jgi:flagellin
MALNSFCSMAVLQLKLIFTEAVMSGFIYGVGSGVSGYWMSMNLAKSSDAAAKLASGMRISGRAGGGDITAYYLGKANAADAENTARGTAVTAATAFADAQRVDAAALLLYRAEEGGVGAKEATALTAAAKTLLDAVTTAGVTKTATKAGVDDALGEVAGLAAGFEAQAIAEAAAAAIQREGNENMIAVDFGSESAAVTRYQILQQASAAMVAQANQSQSAILALFK